MTHNKQQTTRNNQQPTTNNTQRTTNNKQRTTNNNKKQITKKPRNTELIINRKDERDTEEESAKHK